MGSNPFDPPKPILFDALSHRPAIAAKVLGIGQRKLWNLTHPRGPIKCVKAGTCTLYPVSELRAWLANEAAKGDAQ